MQNTHSTTVPRALAAACCALLVTMATGCAGSTPEPRGTERAAKNAPAEKTADLDCNETEDEFHAKGYVYLYRYEHCKGGHDARDKTPADSDYGDGEGYVKDFDNRTDSIINTTSSHVEFYNYPNYNKGAGDKGDSFCVGPGEWVNRLQFYGDADGKDDWWKNSISSHRKVKESDCDRWFGWGSNR